MSGRAPRLTHARRAPGGLRVRFRPVRAQDGALVQAYVRALSPAARYNRFLGPVSELPPRELDRVTHLDLRREMALIAEARVGGATVMVGEARYAATADGLACECALSVGDAWRGRGLGLMLLADVECRARALGVRTLVADVLRTNVPMQRLARKAGFAFGGIADEARLVRLTKDLTQWEPAVPGEAAAAMPAAA